MKTLPKIGSIIVYATYAVCGGLLALSLLPGIGWKALDVATASMNPAVPRGSLVLVHRVAFSKIRVGNIITFKNPANPAQTITHRVVSVGSIGKIPTFTTKGDANMAPDRTIVGGSVVGKVYWHVPYLGFGLNWMRTLPGLILLLVLPGIVIVISELRRLWRALEEPIAAAPPILSPQPQPVRKPQASRRRLDGLGPIIAIIAVCLLVSHSTLAQLNSHAALKATTISTATRANHLVIARVVMGGSPVCNVSNDQNVALTTAGSGSVANLTINDKCEVSESSSNNVSISQSSSQDTLTGNITISSSSQTSGSSGSSSNSDHRTTTVIIQNGQGHLTSQWFELYNPTSQPISIVGWKIHDNTNANEPLPNLVIGAGASVTLSSSDFTGGKIGNGLTPSGDRLILLNASSQNVDALSWGSDISIFSPAIPALMQNGQAYRTNPDYDTNSAADWAVKPQ